MKNFREQRQDDQTREAAAWFKKHKKALEKVARWLEFQSGSPPPTEDLQNMRHWFVKEGPGSYQRRDRIPWKGPSKFELEIHQPAEMDGATFRPVFVHWADGREGMFDMDASWFEANGVDIASDEAEQLIRQKLNHKQFRFVYRYFERGQSRIHQHCRGHRSDRGYSEGWGDGPLVKQISS